jgi:hypothetical protein
MAASSSLEMNFIAESDSITLISNALVSSNAVINSTNFTLATEPVNPTKSLTFIFAVLVSVINRLPVSLLCPFLSRALLFQLFPQPLFARPRLFQVSSALPKLLLSQTPVEGPLFLVARADKLPERVVSVTALKGDDDVSTDGVVLERERWVHASEPGERADETSLFVCKEALILVPFMFAELMRGWVNYES